MQISPVTNHRLFLLFAVQRQTFLGLLQLTVHKLLTSPASFIYCFACKIFFHAGFVTLVRDGKVE